jgi:hypothetical protein
MLKTVENYVSDFVKARVKKELDDEAKAAERKKWYSLETEEK